MNGKMLAVWIWADTIAREGAEQVMTRLHHAGVTDLYLLTKGQAGSACFDDCKTAYKIACPGENVLPRAIESAHRRGMRVHAWLTSSHDAAYKERHPEQGLYHFTLGRSSGVITLTSKEYLDYMRRFTEELFRKCAPDGLHLDYIRYGTLRLGWGEEDIEALKKRGANTDKLKALMVKTFFGDNHDERAIFDAYEAGDADALSLAEYRRENVRAFAQALTDTARAVKPDAILSAALMPEGAYIAGDRTQGVSAVAFAALHYGQSYIDAAQLYDHAAIMSYAPTYGENGAWVKRLAKNAMDVYGCRVVAGLQSFDAGTTDTLIREYAAASELCDHEKFLGCALFRAGETPVCVERYAGGECGIEMDNALPRAITKIIFSPEKQGVSLSPARGETRLRETAGGLVAEGSELIKPFEKARFAIRQSAPCRVLARPFSQDTEERAWIVEE